MNESIIYLAVTVQMLSALVALFVIPWRGRRLERAARSLYRVHEYVRDRARHRGDYPQEPPDVDPYMSDNPKSVPPSGSPPLRVRTFSVV